MAKDDKKQDKPEKKPAQQQQQQAPKPKKEKKICRPLEPLPGSNMRRSSCHTKDEWAKIDGTGVDPNEDRGPMPGVRSGDGVTSGTGSSDAH